MSLGSTGRLLETRFMVKYISWSNIALRSDFLLSGQARPDDCDSCITQLKAQGPSRTCNESKEEEEDAPVLLLAAEELSPHLFFFFFITLEPRVQ